MSSPLKGSRGYLQLDVIYIVQTGSHRKYDENDLQDLLFRVSVFIHTPTCTSGTSKYNKEKESNSETQGSDPY